MLRRGTKRKLDSKTTDTLIGEGTICDGNIMSEASLRIEGQMNGDIACTGDVTIGQNAVVESNIEARDVIIAGQARGNIHTKGKLIVTSTGTLIGNINVKSFVIQEGGIFQGTSSMSTSTAAADRSAANVIDAQTHKQQKAEQKADQKSDQKSDHKSDHKSGHKSDQKAANAN